MAGAKLRVPGQRGRGVQGGSATLLTVTNQIIQYYFPKQQSNLNSFISVKYVGESLHH